MSNTLQIKELLTKIRYYTNYLFLFLNKYVLSNIAVIVIIIVNNLNNYET